jgi:hypothetical protein
MGRGKSGLSGHAIGKIGIVTGPERMILEDIRNDVGIADDCSCRGISPWVSTPFVDRRHELFDGFLFRPEVLTQQRCIGDRPRALLDHQLFDTGMPEGGIEDRRRSLHSTITALLTIQSAHVVIPTITTGRIYRV